VKTTKSLICVAAILTLTAGCANGAGQQTGASLGGSLGSLAGSIAGAAVGGGVGSQVAAGVGGILGGLAGSVAGGSVGAQADTAAATNTALLDPLEASATETVGLDASAPSFSTEVTGAQTIAADAATIGAGEIISVETISVGPAPTPSATQIIPTSAQPVAASIPAVETSAIAPDLSGYVSTGAYVDPQPALIQ